MDLITSPVAENFHNNESATVSSNNNEAEDNPNENSSANSSLNKMEPLFVEEDEDDGLGTESLRMSGSDSEDGENISPVRRKKRPTQKIIESDDDDEIVDRGGKETSEEVQEMASETDKVSTKRKKFSVLVDSDSESEEQLENIKKSSEKNNEFPDSASDSNKVSGKPSKFSTLIDSDSESEEQAEDSEENTNIPIKITIKNAEIQKKKRHGNKQKNNKKKSLGQSKKTENSNELSSDSENTKEPKKSSKNKKISDLVDSDHGSSNATSSEHEEEGQDSENPISRPKKTQRASAKKAMDEMQAIQSETQRLYRETQVNIPYHKPKRHTLKEFLTRRTIVKPELNLVGPGKSLKMSSEELEEYAKHLEERAKEATEFFKSESEDELKNIQEEEPTDMTSVGEKEKISASKPTEPSEQQKEAEIQPEDATRPLNTEEIDQILQEHEFISQPTTQDLLKDIQTEHEEPYPTPSTSNFNTISNEVENILNPSSGKTSALAELKRRLITEKNIPLVPKLKGDANMIIDFETGDMFARKPTGVENLFQRFIKSNKNNKIKPEETTPSQELQTTLKVAVIQDSNKEKEPKPGAAYMKLKQNLQTLISRKRREDSQKKIEETKEEEREYNKCCGLDDEDENDEEEENEVDNESKKANKKTEHEIVIDEEENEIELDEYENDEDEENLDEDKTKDEENEENEESEETAEENNEENQTDVDENNDTDSTSSDEVEDEHLEESSMRKHRVIKAFEDSDDEVNPGLNETSSGVLYTEDENKNPEDVENELLGLCSGNFAETQRAPVISQIPITQTPGNVTETELEDLCSGVFNENNTQIKETQIEETQIDKSEKTALRIVSSDEEKEPDEDLSNADLKKVKKLKKKKKKHIKLGFSDDEEDESEEELNSAIENEDDVEEEEIPQTYIDYDSDENEIEVQMSKKDRLKQANTFLEKEAELSESEWGSADEDERNLDKYDNELGDEDEFDQQKLHTELEQIHMRKVLDDDIREVKKIQEMLFDDEEADGVGRQRKFRWKNVENGFSLDDPAGGGADNDEQIDSADDDEEMKWRKMRFEREQFLMKKTSEEILNDVSTTELGKKLIESMKPNIISADFEVQEEVFEVKEYKKPSFLIKQNDLSKLRNSLLNYDKNILAKIADQITKSGDYEVSGPEQVQKKACKDGNFLFAPLTEEEKMLRKRKAEEKKMCNVPKKMKTTNTKSLFLDGLL